MSDASTTPDSRSEERDLRDEAGNPGTDRSFLSDMPPAQIDEEAVRAHADEDGEEAGRTADAARD